MHLAKLYYFPFLWGATTFWRMPHVFMFPGQSSRYPEMLDRIIQAWPPAYSIVDHASEVLSRDLLCLYKGGQGAFDRNRDVQVGVFLASHLHYAALASAGVDAELSVGLSLGEYNHLVHIGAISFEDALRLVEARGRAYDLGPTGMMACVSPLELEDLLPVMKQAQQFGIVEIANYNSPTQHVVAGERAGVEALVNLVYEAYAVDAVVIEHRIPMHSSVFRPVAELLRPHLKEVQWQPSRKPYLPNVAATPLAAPTAAEIVDRLSRHVYSPVQFKASIDGIVDRYPDAVFVEVGPRSVLYNLLHRRWHKNPRRRTDAPNSLADNLSSLVGELRSATRVLN